MKIDIHYIDTDNFKVIPHIIEGELCHLVIPNNIQTKWNADTLKFRSSIWNSAGNLISAGYPKFFNWGENIQLSPLPTNRDKLNIIEKIDGSCLIISRYKDTIIIRTRGTVDATALGNGHEIATLKHKYPSAFEPILGCSFIFEWVSPENKIVIRYPEPDLILTGIIRHSDYTLYSQSELDVVAKYMGFKRPERFSFDSIDQMVNVVHNFKGKEGVCCYSNNDQQILKLKSIEYLSKHRLKDELGNFDRVVDFWFASGEPSFQETMKLATDLVDYETAKEIMGDVSRICEGKKEVETIIQAMIEFINRRHGKTRKELALDIMQAYGNTNRSGMVFCILDGKTLNMDHRKKLLYQVLKN